MNIQELKKITSIVALDEQTAFDRKAICSRLRKLMSQQAEIKAEIDELKKTLISGLEDEGRELFISDGIKALFMTRSGSIKYNSIPELQELDDEYIEQFRGKDQQIWKITAV